MSTRMLSAIPLYGPGRRFKFLLLQSWLSMLSRVRFRISYSWFFPGLFLLSIALPLALFVWTALRERAQIFYETERVAARTVSALHEHAVNVLESHEVLLHQVDRQIAGRAWDDIENDNILKDDLTQLNLTLNHVNGIRAPRKISSPSPYESDSLIVRGVAAGRGGDDEPARLLRR
jgi:hypothetical protein